MNKEICIECEKKENCTTRKEIHEENFIVSECESFKKLELTELDKLRFEISNMLYKNIAESKSWQPIVVADKILDLIKEKFVDLETQLIIAKYSNNGVYYCTSKEDKGCWAKQLNGVCATFENCKDKVSEKDYRLNKLKEKQ